MNNFDKLLKFIGIGFTIGLVLIVIFIFGFNLRPTRINLGPIEFEIPTATPVAVISPSVPIHTPSQVPTALPSLVSTVVTATATSIQPTQTMWFQLTTTPTAAVSGTSGSATLLIVLCMITLIVGGVLVYLLFFRNRRGGYVRQNTAESDGKNQPNDHAAQDIESPIAQFVTTYKLGVDLYDDSFSIDSPTGEFLGECGVGISKTIGVGDPLKVTAFEVWLFDKNDIQTLTKVLMSEKAYKDPATIREMQAKGEPVLVAPGAVITLQTAALQLTARVVDMSYGQGALPAKSFFDRLTLELNIWPIPADNPNAASMVTDPVIFGKGDKNQAVQPPIAQFATTYALGDDMYDDSFSIDSPGGVFLGECGVGISKTVGIASNPKKVTALEVWLFDKNDIQTITKVLMSEKAYKDPATYQEMQAKGEPVLITPGAVITLQTATLQLTARVVDMSYGQGALPAKSFFDRLSLELNIWPKPAS